MCPDRSDVRHSDAALKRKEKEYNYYLGLRKMVKEKSMMDMDMIFDRYPNELIPFDFETYFQSKICCEQVVTNCVTGRAEYLEEKQEKTGC